VVAINLLLVFAWGGLIFIVSSIPGNNIPSLFPFQSVLFHVVEYAIFAWLIKRALKEYHPNLNPVNYFYWTIAICLIYAAGDEFHQAFVPFRDASLLDVSFDTLGAIIGSLLSTKLWLI